MRVLIFVSIFLGLLVPSQANTATSYSGTWRVPGAKPHSELRTIDHGKGDVEFQLDLRGGPPANSNGGMDGRISVKDGKAVFETVEFDDVCRIEFSFTPKQVVLRQAAGSWVDCGFGEGVVAAGTFLRISKKVPTFIRR
ncbi:MAG TPA: hypothetical protein VMU50_09715 [Polyangia bacterium]|nr:hypothetical protein [Polyangia bacterium]